MASSPRTEREAERRHNIRTLVIASAASAAAAAVVSQLWIAGTWIAAAITPVLVALVSEIINRPADRLARAWTAERPALPEDAPAPDSAARTRPRTPPRHPPRAMRPCASTASPPHAPPARRKLAVGAIRRDRAARVRDRGGNAHGGRVARRRVDREGRQAHDLRRRQDTTAGQEATGTERDRRRRPRDRGARDDRPRRRRAHEPRRRRHGAGGPAARTQPPTRHDAGRERRVPDGRPADRSAARSAGAPRADDVFDSFECAIHASPPPATTGHQDRGPGSAAVTSRAQPQRGEGARDRIDA